MHGPISFPFLSWINSSKMKNFSFSSLCIIFLPEGLNILLRNGKGRWFFQFALKCKPIENKTFNWTAKCIQNIRKWNRNHKNGFNNWRVTFAKLHLLLFCWELNSKVNDRKCKHEKCPCNKFVERNVLWKAAFLEKISHYQ